MLVSLILVSSQRIGHGEAAKYGEARRCEAAFEARRSGARARQGRVSRGTGRARAGRAWEGRAGGSRERRARKGEARQAKPKRGEAARSRRGVAGRGETRLALGEARRVSCAPGRAFFIAVTSFAEIDSPFQWAYQTNKNPGAGTVKKIMPFAALLGGRLLATGN